MLRAVKIPLEDTKTQYIDEDGSDGFAAFGFKLGSQVKVPYRLILPDKLPLEFSILIRTRPRSLRDGYLFAVVNAYELVVQLGIKLSQAEQGTVISLVYTDPSQVSSQIIANFTVPRFVNSWTRIALKVTSQDVTLYFNCNKNETIPVMREPLQFDSASTLYIAQAGDKIKQAYEVSTIYFLPSKSLSKAP